MELDGVNNNAEQLQNTSDTEGIKVNFDGKNFSVEGLGETDPREEQFSEMLDTRKSEVLQEFRESEEFAEKKEELSRLDFGEVASLHGPEPLHLPFLPLGMFLPRRPHGSPRKPHLLQASLLKCSLFSRPPPTSPNKTTTHLGCSGPPHCSGSSRSTERAAPICCLAPAFKCKSVESRACVVFSIF